jgi:GNAT superfamily N-acetyltransferase
MESDVVLRPYRADASRLARAMPLDRTHRDELQDFLTRLDRDSRCRRFGHAATDELLLTHAVKALSEASCVMGIFADQALRGVLELYSCKPAPILEGAIVVEQAWRRRGFGASLLRAGLGWACGARENSVRLIFTRDNWPMRQLASKANARFDLVLDEICAEVATDAVRLPF